MGNTEEDRKKPKKRLWTNVEHESDSGPEGAAWHKPPISRRTAIYKNSTGCGHLAWPGIRMLVMVCK